MSSAFDLILEGRNHQFIVGVNLCALEYTCVQKACSQVPADKNIIIHMPWSGSVSTWELS